LNDTSPKIEPSEENKDKTTLRLLFVTIESITVSATIGVLANSIFPTVSSEIQLLKEAHWIIWIYITLLIYTFIGLLLEAFSNIQFLKNIFIIPEWTVLRSFGEQSAAKLSYYALLLIPILVYSTNLKIEWLNLLIAPLPLNIKLTYFASWFVAISLIIYSISSPKTLKKNPVEKLKTLNLVLNNIDGSNIKITTENDPITEEEDQSLIVLRAICFYFYIIGVISAVIVLIRGAILVVDA
jgi:hypothetical protein